MNAKILVFVICVEAILCLLIYNLHDFTINNEAMKLTSAPCLHHPDIPMLDLTNVKKVTQTNNGRLFETMPQVFLAFSSSQEQF